MDANLDRIFIKFSVDKLKQLAERTGDCLSRLSYDQTWAREGEHENAVGNLVLHLCGNVRQWIDAGVAGQPDTRIRSGEFRARGDIQPERLREFLQTTVEDAVTVIRRLSAERLSETIRVQGYEVTVLEAIYHVVEHFAQHTGQIIFATKRLTGEDLGFYKHLNQSSGHGEKIP